MKESDKAYQMWKDYWARHEEVHKILRLVQESIVTEGKHTVTIEGTYPAQLIDWFKDEGFSVKRNIKYITLNWKYRGTVCNTVS